MRNKAFFYVGWEQTRRDLSSNSPDHHRPGESPRHRSEAAAGIRAERPDREVLHREVRSAGEPGEPRDRPLDPLRQRRAVQQRRRPRPSLEQATDFLDAMDSVAGQVVTTMGSSKLNEFRMQYAHRHQQSVRNSDSGSGPAVTITRRRQLRQPAERHRPGQRRLRFQAEHHAGDRQLHLHPRRAQLQVRRRLPAHPRRADRGAAIPLHLPDRSRRIRRRSPAPPVRLFVDDADHRRSQLRDGHEHLQHVRSGRLADRADREGALRRPLRPVPLSRRAANAPLAQTQRVQHRQEQLGPARRRRLGAVADDRGARQRRASCTTSRFSAATSRRCS